jgi:hypothetical protein
MNYGRMGWRENSSELKEALRLHGHPVDINPAYLPEPLFDDVMAELCAIRGVEPAPAYVGIATITKRKEPA